jgi:hypothetical protein
MHSTLRKMVTTIAALAAVAAGSAAIAGAASKGTSTTPGASTTPGPGSAAPSSQRPQRPNETALTGDTAAKVRKAAQDKVPGGTILRVETDADQGAAYEAHVRKSDGTEVTVLVDKSFKVVGVRSCGGPGGRGQRGGGPGGPPPGTNQPGDYQGGAPYQGTYQ